MQEQADAHAGQGANGDYCQKFEASTHRTLGGITGFHGSQHQGGHRRETVRPPANLR